MNRSKRVYIASDHAGLELKRKLTELMPDCEWLDLGPVKANRVDYPDYAERLCAKLLADESKPLGVLICGTGIGMSIAANKVPGIRAAHVECLSSARLAREHNDANVVCIGARFLAAEYAVEIVTEFLTTDFTHEARHAGRILKIQALEQKHPRDLTASSPEEA